MILKLYLGTRYAARWFLLIRGGGGGEMINDAEVPATQGTSYARSTEYITWASGL